MPTTRNSHTLNTVCMTMTMMTMMMTIIIIMIMMMTMMVVAVVVVVVIVVAIIVVYCSGKYDGSSDMSRENNVSDDGGDNR